MESSWNGYKYIQLGNQKKKIHEHIFNDLNKFGTFFITDAYAKIYKCSSISPLSHDYVERKIAKQQYAEIYEANLLNNSNPNIVNKYDVNITCVFIDRSFVGINSSIPLKILDVGLEFSIAFANNKSDIIKEKLKAGQGLTLDAFDNNWILKHCINRLYHELYDDGCGLYNTVEHSMFHYYLIDEMVKIYNCSDRRCQQPLNYKKIFEDFK